MMRLVTTDEMVENIAHLVVSRVECECCTAVVFGLQIPIDAYPKQRARTTRYGTYTPAQTREFEETAGLYMNAYVSREPSVKASMGNRIALAIVFHTTRMNQGDLDNYLKAVMDAGQKILWNNDRQVKRAVVDLYEGVQEPSITMVWCSIDCKTGEVN